MAIVKQPIWKNIEIDVSDRPNLIDKVGFTISRSNDETPEDSSDHHFEQFYKGYSMKVGGRCQFDVRSVIMNELPVPLVDFDPSWTPLSNKWIAHPDTRRYFTVTTSFDDFSTTDQTFEYDIYNDWTYDTALSYKGWLSMPISRIADQRQFILASYRGDIGDSISIGISGSSPYTSTIQNRQVTFISKFSGEGTITAGGNPIYEIKDTCCDFCLYYINKRGGWDSMLFEGCDIVTDNYTRHSFINSYDEQIDYKIDDQVEYELTTGILNETQSMLMNNLSGTVCAFLHDLTTGRIFRVNILDTQVKRKTWRNEGRQLLRYTVKIKKANIEYRL